MKETLTRRDFLKYCGLGTAGAAAALAFAGCSGKDDGSKTNNTQTAAEVEAVSQQRIEDQGLTSDFVSTADTETEVSEDERYILPKLIVGASNPDTLPPYSPNMDGRTPLWEIYEGLYEQPTFGARMNPVLADKNRGGNNGDGIMGYDHEDGTTEYTVYIYDYIYDSQGNHLTAEDVKYSYDYYYTQNSSKVWDHCDVVDETTIKFTFKQELTQILQLDGEMAVFIFTKAAFEASADPFTTSACGTGRYALTEFIAGSHMDLEKRDEYWQTDESLISRNQTANIQNLHIDFIAETAQKVIALQTNAVDMIEKLPTEYIDEFDESNPDNTRYKVFTYRDNLSHHILFNCHPDAITGNLDLRLAIAWAVNIDGLVEGMGKGFGQRLIGMGNANFSDYNPAWEALDNYNTHKGAVDASVVQSYLDAAGYKGEEIKCMCNNPDSEKEGTIIQAQLQQYGIKIKLFTLSGGAANDAAKDPTQWDMRINQGASKGYLTSIFAGSTYNMHQATADYGGLSTSFIDNEELAELADTLLEFPTWSQEGVDKLYQMLVDNCYVVGLVSPYCNVIIPQCMTSIALTSKNWVLHTACTFEAPEA